MKVLVFTDLHADKKAYKILKNKIKKEKPDLLINCGDFTMFGRSIKSWADKLDFGIKSLVVPGNHESAREIRDLVKGFEYIVDIHKKTKRINSILFLGAGEGGFSDELDSLEFSEKKFSEAINKFRKKYPKGKVVLVTHVPPYRTRQDIIFDEHVGARNVRWFIRDNKIDYSFCGHIHECFKTKDKIGKTIVVNPGDEGMVFEI